MLDEGIEPYIESPKFRWNLPIKERAYEDLDSIAIGVAVCIEKGLLNVCEHTKYAISAKGSNFIKPDGREFKFI
jgi:hypothetical protein